MLRTVYVSGVRQAGSAAAANTTSSDYHLSRLARWGENKSESARGSPRLASSTLADVLDGRLSAGLRLGRGLGSRGVLCGLEPVADADRNRAGGLHGVRGEYRAARGGGEAR